MNVNEVKPKMMDNPKRKNEEPSWWHKVADLFLLAKSFEYRVDAPPAFCAHQLRELAQSKTGYIYPISREVKTIEVYIQVYDFEVRLNRHGRGMTYNTAKASGTILFDEALEKTTIRGEITIGNLPLFHFLTLILAILIAIVCHSPILRDIGFAVVFFGINIAFLLLMASDYGKLHYLLEDTFTTGSESNKHDE